MQMKLEDAVTFFATLFYGIHHIPGKVKPFGFGWCIIYPQGCISTFDFDFMTRLVFLAHDKCIRAEVGVAGRYLRIAIHKRQPAGTVMSRHPTLEQALNEWKERMVVYD